MSWAAGLRVYRTTNRSLAACHAHVATLRLSSGSGSAIVPRPPFVSFFRRPPAQIDETFVPRHLAERLRSGEFRRDPDLDRRPTRYITHAAALGRRETERGRSVWRTPLSGGLAAIAPCNSFSRGYGSRAFADPHEAGWRRGHMSLSLDTRRAADTSGSSNSPRLRTEPSSLCPRAFKSR